MMILSVDTCFDACSVALCPCDQGTDKVLYQPQLTGQAELLLAQLKRLKGEHSDAYQTISHLVVTLGPGRFTGVRIGLSAMRALALVQKVPLIGLSSLKLIAHRYFREEIGHDLCNGRLTLDHEFIAVIKDAKRGTCYIEILDLDFASIKGPNHISQEQLSMVLPQNNCFIISDMAAHIEIFEHDQNRHCKLYKQPPHALDGALLAKPVLNQHLSDQDKQLAGFKAIGFIGEAVKPLYLRPADAKPQQGKALKRQ